MFKQLPIALLGLAPLISAAPVQKAVPTENYLFDTADRLIPTCELPPAQQNPPADKILTLPLIPVESCDSLFQAFDYVLEHSAGQEPDSSLEITGLESGIMTVAEIGRKVPEYANRYPLFKTWFADPCSKNPNVSRYAGNAPQIFAQFVIGRDNLAAWSKQSKRLIPVELM